jgi:chorismate dehydratase
MTGRDNRPINVGAPECLSVQPLVDSFNREMIDSGYQWSFLSPSGCADHLNKKTLDVALIPSIDYSRIRGRRPLIIIPHIAVSSKQKSQNALLFFKPGVSKIETVAVDERDSAVIALLKIILKEKYRIEPAFLSMPPDIDNMLLNTDAAMITGDEALILNESYESKIDLGEDWEDLTEGLPFVFAFWAGDPKIINREIVSDFLSAKQQGLERLSDLAREHTGKSALSEESGLEHLIDCMSYDFGKIEHRGLMEFYSYCYYYGFISEIPELHFFRM